MRFLIALAMAASGGHAADFTTYIGYSNQYQVAAITSDSHGNTFVTGGRVIQLQPTGSAADVFVTKLDAAGNVVFTTTFGGKGSDQGNAIAVDPMGDIWVGGTTTSENFPLRDPFQTASGQGFNPPTGTGFLVKLAPEGTVIYSSYFGGLLGNSGVKGVGTDQTGNLYVTRNHRFQRFSNHARPTCRDVIANEITSIFGAFITKLECYRSTNPLLRPACRNRDRLQWREQLFLNGRVRVGASIAVDGAGNAYIAGGTNATDLPVTPGGLPGDRAFAAKINSAGNELAYLTYLGPPAVPVAYGPAETINATAIAADASGNAYLTGFANDPLFPATPGACQTKLNANASLARLLNPFRRVRR